MTMTDMNWIINIENSAAVVANAFGSEVVASVFARYGASCIEDLSPSYYGDVFSDLTMYEADC